MKQMTSLSSQVFLVLHDPFSGKRRVSQELLECGVSAAQLADLIIARQLGIKDDHVVLAGPVQAGRTDRIGEYVLGCVAEQSRTYSVRQWVSSLGAAVTDLVVRELVDTGVVRHERPRGLRRRKPDRFPAEDLLRASSSRVRVRRMFIHPAEFDLAGATLASIVGVLGAQQQVFEVDDTRGVLRELNAYMPLPLQAVMTGLAATVAAASVALGGR